MVATDHWADLVIRFVFLSGFVILFIIGLLMAIDAYFLEKTGKATTRFGTAAKVFFGIWFLNNIALGVFGILAEWFSLEKWEIWATYAIALLIGLVIWLIAKKAKPKSYRSLLVFALLFLAFLITLVVFLIALITGHY